MMWADTGRRLTFLGIDGRAAFLLLVVLYAPRLWTLCLAFVGIMILVWLERKGYTIPNALRRLRIFFTGQIKPAVIGRRRGRSDR